MKAGAAQKEAKVYSEQSEAPARGDATVVEEEDPRVCQPLFFVR